MLRSLRCCVIFFSRVLSSFCSIMVKISGLSRRRSVVLITFFSFCFLLILSE